MIKQIILDILDYLKFQVANDRCTPEELRSMYDTITENLDVDATIGDIAKHYGQSESNVRNVAARSYIGKPKRRVYYNLAKFIKLIPASWHKSQKQQSTA
ncbi:MAG: hypothetical protein K2M94_06015 [Paramuribaculum sp.]|nr:hypothetical protein [Paramuribaculum sp.]